MKHHHKKKMGWLIEGILIAFGIVVLFQGITYFLSYISPSEYIEPPTSQEVVKQQIRMQFSQNAVAIESFPVATSAINVASSSSLIIATATKPVDINMLSLTMKSWVWVRTINVDGTAVYPNKGEEYTATFDFQDTLQLRAGCKTGFGLYTLDGSALTIRDMFITEKGCADYDEKIDTYMSSFESVTAHSFNQRGELVLRTKGLRGVMIFK